MKEEEPLLSVHDVAKILDKSGETIRVYSRKGKLPSMRTAGGWRLFRMSDVKEFAAKYLANEHGCASTIHEILKKSKPPTEN